MRLNREQRKYLDGVDQSDLWEIVDDETLKSHVDRMQRQYPMPASSFAVLLMELIGGAQHALARGMAPGAESEATAEDVKKSVDTWISEQMLVAAYITRKERGRPL